MQEFLDGRVVLHAGDCREVIRSLPDACIDSVVTDPPYALVSIVKRFANSPRSEATENTENPYGRTGRGFMGQRWDNGETAFAAEFWTEVLRVLKPGGHVIAFSGTRTYHRMVVAIEDAGFEIRDQIGWLYGSGFPKSHDVSKGIDRRGPHQDYVAFPDFARHYAERRKAAGMTHAQICALGGFFGSVNHGGTSGNCVRGYALPTVEQWDVVAPVLKLDAQWKVRVAREEYEREIVGSRKVHKGVAFTSDGPNEVAVTLPGSDAARQWQGWGTALKPAYEPICLAQKPYTAQGLLSILVPIVGELICRVASSEKTDTHLSERLQTCGFWSTATLLNNCLAAISGTESKFTTETATALTTDLKILKSLLSRTMQGTITQDETQPHGAGSSASLAVAISRSVIAKCERLASTTAGEIVIDWLAEGGSGPAGSNLSPLWEPICVARKALVGTVAANVLEHGTGALNIGACRVSFENDADNPATNPLYRKQNGYKNGNAPDHNSTSYKLKDGSGDRPADASGRWPANVIHDGSDEVVAAFPDSDGQQGDVRGTEASQPFGGHVYGEMTGRHAAVARGDTGSAARFFYTAKADAEDRLGSKHPTVKPLNLMQYLCRLVTPPGGTVLDPFAGTGTTGEAAWREGFKAVLIEREPEYQADIARRMDLVLKPTKRAAVAKTKNNLMGAEGTPLFGGEAA